MSPTNPGSISRRKFIASWIAVGISIPVISSCKEGGGEDRPDCETTADILGPYYKAGSPVREHIIPVGDLTEPLVIEGKVFSDCSNVLTEATVEVWNANAEGAYDTSDDFLFRGKFVTNADGTYRFKTIIPGRYLNGGTFRPSHIHFRITAPGHHELVSQIYFKDDPFIDTDPWASSPQAKERILTVTQDENGTDTITFDIYLSKS